MAKVHVVPISAAIVGAAAATALGLVAVHWYRSWVPIVGWLATLSYLLLSTVFLLSALRRRRTTLFGPANVVTAVRSTLVGLIGGMVVVSFAVPIPVALLVALIVPALLLDAVDGWVARRTDSVSELGARFDMEVDAFLLLVLSVYVSNDLGIWVLAIGSMRYAFVLAGLIFPWFRRILPSRPWRKVVTAVQGIALATAVARILPGLDALLVAIALALLVESFGRDVIWLAVRRARPDSEEEDSPVTRTMG